VQAGRFSSMKTRILDLIEKRLLNRRDELLGIA
jgi:hypothetical protein